MNGDEDGDSTGVSPAAPGTDSGRPGRRRVWLLNVGMVAAAAGLFDSVTHLGRLHTGVTAVPFVVLVITFALTETFAVHLKFRQDAHTFSLSEIPLVVGLFLVAPSAMVGAQILGGGLVLAIHRRQSAIKLVFDLGLYGVATSVAELVFRFVLGGGSTLGPRSWAAASLAAITASAVSVPAIYLAVTFSDGRPHSREFLRPVGFSLFVALVTCHIGLVAVEVLASRPLAEVLLIIPTVGLYVANRAYVRERERHQELQFLYDSTRLLHQSPEVDSAIDALLVKATLALRADLAVLAYHPADGEQLLRSRVGPGTERETMAPVDGDVLTQMRVLIDSTSGTYVFEEGPIDPAVARMVGDSRLSNGIVVALQGETRMIGALVVANHLSEVSGFQPSDLRLLVTLANQLAVALENGRLEQSLTQLRLLERQLTHQASHDPLTGLANRVLFSEKVNESIGRSPLERGGNVAVMFIDIDDFKTVNDSLGHAAGDSLLITVAERLSSVLRGGDVAARLGGDEFALLIDGVEGLQAAFDIADRLLEALGKPMRVSDNTLLVHASVGIALWDGEGGADTLMRNADTAMYGAKGQGKGRWVMFSPDMHDAALQRQSLIRDLADALDNNEFLVHFQPMVDLRTGEVVAVEALARWEHPTKGLLGPDTFVPLAEETGQIGRLTQSILYQACKLAASWPVNPGSSIAPSVSVNLSARDFDNPNLSSLVELALTRSGLQPTRLILEITESLMMSDSVRSSTTLDSLAATGVQLALDDFGTGYSSLSYLSRLPLQWVKIAKTFVDHLSIDRTHDALAQGIIELGHLLNLRIIAEGIEHPDQVETLRRFQCDVGQGYLHSPPLPPTAFLAWLASRSAAVQPLFS